MPEERMPSPSRRVPMRWLLFVSLALVAMTALPYLQVATFDFVNYDDQVYVSENLQLQQGFSMETLRWLATTDRGGNWHPLVWITYLVDYHLFGLDAGMHHLSNLLYHLANVVLLFWVLYLMTGAAWRSALVAALFGLHPLHVESVAWVSERKDTLSTLFWLLTMLAYWWYTRGKGLAWRRYVLVVLAFAGGLMSKSMIVTLPFVLLLMDIWPLRRLDLSRPPRKWRWQLLVMEKVPLLMLAAGVAVVTMVTQKQVGAMADHIALPLRVGNALTSYLMYLVKTVWPLELHIFYPHPLKDLSWGVAAVGLLQLIAATVAVLIQARRRPYLLVGWLWYVGTLVPVIGLVQVGEQAMADRYTYVPLIGIFLMLAWGLPELVRKEHERRVAVAMALVVAVCVPLTWRQVGTWRDTEHLFSHALRLDPDNYVAHGNLAALKAEQEAYEEALAHFRAVLERKPGSADALSGIGAIYYKQDRLEEAREYMLKALKRKPLHADTNLNYGILLTGEGRHAEALQHFELALKHQREDNPELLYSLARCLMELNRLAESERYAQQALTIAPAEAKAPEIAPDAAKVHNLLGILRRKESNWAAAKAAFNKALSIDPSLGEAWYNLGLTYEATDQPEKAAEAYESALANGYRSELLYFNLGFLRHRAGDVETAMAHYRAALALNEAYARAHHNLGAALNAGGQLQEAAHHLQRAVELEPGDSNMRNTYAVNLIYQGQYEAAIEQLTIALRLDPNNAAAQRALAEARRQASP